MELPIVACWFLQDALCDGRSRAKECGLGLLPAGTRPLANPAPAVVEALQIRLNDAEPSFTCFKGEGAANLPLHQAVGISDCTSGNDFAAV